MSIETSRRVWNESRQSGSSLLALLALADRADDDGYCWPSISEIARRARVSERQVKRLIEQLEAVGELYVMRNKGRGRTSDYLVLTGLTEDKIARALVLRFDMKLEDAQQVSGELIARQKGDTQGEKVTPATPIPSEKGDIQGKEKVTPSALKGDIQDKKVTPSALKGDMGPEKSVYERQRTSVEQSIEPSEGTAAGLEGEFDFDDDPASSLPPSAPLDRAKLIRGKVPSGNGETPTEVYFEFHPFTEPSLNRLTRPSVAETVNDLDLWREVIDAWMMEGNNPNNIKGQLDWYATGKRSNKPQHQADRGNHSFNGASHNGNHDSGPQPQLTEADRAEARRFRAAIKQAAAKRDAAYPGGL